MATPRWAALAMVACCSLIAGWTMRGNSRKLLGHFVALKEVVPTPSPRPDAPWQECHEQHVETIKEADEAAQGFNLMFYGDSITEAWVDTDHCLPCGKRCEGVPAVFERHYAKWGAGVMAIGGDQVAHLLWRLRNGEAPARNQPKVAVVMIGTNDLGAAAAEAADVWQAEEHVMAAVPGITLRVLQTLHTLKDLLPDSHIVLMALLPRGTPGQHILPARRFRLPSLFTQPINMVNLHFRDFTRLDGQLHFLDCGDRFLTRDLRAIDAQLMPDALHPNAAGYELLAECLDPLVTKLMQRSQGGHSASMDGGGGSANGADGGSSASSAGTLEPQLGAAEGA